MAKHFETWLDLASAGQLDGQGDRHSAKPSVRKAFAKYLEGATDISGELMRIIAYIAAADRKLTIGTDTVKLDCWFVASNRWSS